MARKLNSWQMAIKYTIPVFILLAFALTSCSQEKKARTISGRNYAEKELKAAFLDSNLHNVVDNKTPIVNDSLTAISVAEPILFNIYGKENIIKQRPYEIYYIEKYWIIMGTLPKNNTGGTFLIIINSMDSKIIRITHGK